MTPLSPTSLDLTQDNIEQIKVLFPNVFTEGKIDFDALKAELGEHLETEGERYQFTWNGKAQAKRIATTPSMGTLRPAVDESVNWDSTENLYIEGDNLEVLKLLQKAYFGKVKMIYIDPPYNTGKDFVYKDDFKDNLSNYKRLTKQVDDEGNPLTTNSDSSGRYHSNWLNMMYPRLKLARNLLRDDGVIFISIDDNEVHNLRKLCDEIFGEGNFVNQFVWQKNSSGKTVSNQFPVNLEYVLMYCKSINSLKFNVVYKPLSQSTIDSYNKNDNDGRGNYCTVSLQKTSTPGPATTYDYIDNSGKVWVCPSKGWRMVREKVKALEDDGRLYFSGETLREKVYWDERENKGKIADTLWDDLDEGNIGTSEVKKLFGEFVFDFPKPVNFLNRPIAIGSDENDIILDFFSGSATTAHAVMQLNADDGGNRKFILVQIPEATPEGSEARKAGYATIAEIGKERIRRAGRKIQESLATTSTNTALDFGTEPPKPVDCGFKVFKLDTSNIKAWNPTPDTLQEDLLYAVDNILVDRTDEDLLYEVLIKYGLPLTLPIETVQLGQHTGFSVGMGSLVACFAKGITLDTVQAIADMSTPENPVLRVVFRDSGFADDNVKTNAVQRLKQAGVREEDVVSV
jgi:adenine-specific DNA-methyltransferase